MNQKNVTIDDLYGVLHIAITEGAWITLKYLLDLGLNVDGLDEDGHIVELPDGRPLFTESEYGSPPLFTAVEYGDPDVVKLFLETGANPNMKSAGGVSPLVAACEYRGETIAQLLLDYGADIDARNGHDEQAPIHMAVFMEQPGVVKLLCEHGALLETQWPEPDHDPHEPKTPLMLAVTDFVHGSEDKGREILETLLDHGANVNATNELGKTPLMYAAADNSAEAVELLLARGANPFLKDSSGETALDKTQDTRVRVLLHFCHLYSPGGV